MHSRRQLTLVDLKRGQSGIVAGIAGGMGAARRLEALGIRAGKRITKESAMAMGGPITVRVGGTLIGLGYGIASKIVVELPPAKNSE
jgi:ferrous iron transport protein A